MMMHRQLLKLPLLVFTVVLALMLVVNLPCCRSSCDISAARKVVRYGRTAIFNTQRKCVEKVAKSAAKQANVTSPSVIEHYTFKKYKEKPQICMLFSAWTSDCYSHLVHCVASSRGCRMVDVSCVPVDMIEGPYDTGGCNYRSPDTKETCYSKDCDVDEIDKKVIIVPCLALNGVATNSSCVSLVDPVLPGWYMRHYKSFVRFEPEYAASSPETFVEDASWLILKDRFFDGFVSLQPVNLPNYYFHRTNKDDGLVVVSEFEDSEIFRRQASFKRVDFSIKENFPCKSCEEIHELNGGAPSGEYTIRSSAGKETKVQCDMEQF